MFCYFERNARSFNINKSRAEIKWTIARGNLSKNYCPLIKKNPNLRILKSAYAFDNKHVTSISYVYMSNQDIFVYHGWLIYHARYN